MGNDPTGISNGVKKVGNATYNGARKSVNATANVSKSVTKPVRNPRWVKKVGHTTAKASKSFAKTTANTSKSFAKTTVNTAKSAPRTGFKWTTHPQSFADTAKSAYKTGKYTGKSMTNSVVNATNTLPDKAWNMAKNPEQARNALQSIHDAVPQAPNPFCPNPSAFDAFRAAKGDKDAFERISGINKVKENVDLYCEVAENPPNLEDINECDAALLHVDGDGIAVKPQCKFGVAGDDFSAHIGCGDIRDGIEFGFGFEIIGAKIHSEGNSYQKVIENMKCKARYKQNSDRLLNAFKKPNKLIVDVLNALGINIEMDGAWFVIDVTISHAVGASAKAVFKGGWTDTSGYKMVGVGGKLKAVLGLGASVFAGFHESGTSVKVQLGFDNISFMMIVKFDYQGMNNISPPITDQWECVRCTFLNYIDLTYCEGCQGKR